MRITEIVAKAIPTVGKYIKDLLDNVQSFINNSEPDCPDQLPVTGDSMPVLSQESSVVPKQPVGSENTAPSLTSDGTISVEEPPADGDSVPALDTMKDMDDQEQRLDEKDGTTSDEIAGQRQELRDSLIKLGMSMEDIETLDMEQLPDSLKGVSASKLMEVLTDMRDDDLLSALRGTVYLGEMLDRQRNFALPGLCGALLIQYFSLYCPRNVITRGILLFQHLTQDNYRSSEPLADLMGCSKKRIYEDLTAFYEHGFAVDRERSNAPGAGRTSLEDSFRQSMKGDCRVAGLDEEKLQERKEQIELACDLGALRRDYEDLSGSSDEDAPEQMETDEDQEEPTTLSVEKVDIASVYQSVGEISAPLIERLEHEIERATTGNILDLRLFITRFCSNQEWLKEIYENLQTIEINEARKKPSSADGEAGTDQDSGDHEAEECQDYERDEEDLTLTSADGLRHIYIMCLGIGCTQLLNACDSLEKTFAEIEDGADSYTVMKALGSCISIRTLEKTLGPLHSRYARLMRAIKKLEEQKPEDESSSQSTDDPSGVENLPPVFFGEALRELHSLEEKFSAELKLMNRKNAFSRTKCFRKVSDAFDELKILEAILQNTTRTLSTDRETRFAQAILTETVRVMVQDWEIAWGTCKTSRKAVDIVAGLILGTKTKEVVLALYSDYKRLSGLPVEASDNDEFKDPSVEEPAREDTQCDCTREEVEKKLETQKAEALQSVEELQAGLKSIRTGIEEGVKNKQRGKAKGNKTIDNALALLCKAGEELSGITEEACKSNTSGAWEALAKVARGIQRYIEKWESLPAQKDENVLVTYTDASRMAQQVCGKRFHTAVENIRAKYSEISQYLANQAAETVDQYVELEEEEDWFTSHGHLSLQKRCELIRQFWDEGKDPANITTWIEYIVNSEYERTYGDPCKEGTCCRITESELQNAFRYFTGITYSERALWDIFTNKMNYTAHQCEKLDQVGDPHPCREAQFQHIDSMIQNADRSNTLILSVDTKAYIVLGKLKRDNAVLMKGPDAQVFKADDHDYAKIMRKFYPNGCRFVDDSRLDELAILHPVGCYCLNDNTGFVSLVLGKDTSESMANLIIRVIKIKRERGMENLENVLILSDGGGATKANGITWLNELLRIRDETDVNIHMCHYCPGSSKHLWEVSHKCFYGRTLVMGSFREGTRTPACFPPSEPPIKNQKPRIFFSSSIFSG